MACAVSYLRGRRSPDYPAATGRGTRKADRRLRDGRPCSHPGLQPKVAMSRLRLRVILRSPDLPCESLPGLGARGRRVSCVTALAVLAAKVSLPAGRPAPGRFGVEYVPDDGAGRCAGGGTGGAVRAFQVGAGVRCPAVPAGSG